MPGSKHSARPAGKSRSKSGPASEYSGENLARGFLDYYAAKGHRIVESAPLVPDDPTLLFTAAGMVQFKELYSDPDSAPYPTAASVQKCLRAGGKQSDLENVGRTLRHHTFFEMLGNFSFGDYFKKEAIETAWDLSVNVWKMNAEQIWVSVYKDDDEAFELWTKHIGLPAGRVVRLGKADNFWGPVGDTGVCGPSSELYFDTGRSDKGGEKPGDDGERFIEYWNLVFPQFFYTDKGAYDPLPKPGIDTGMGLERLAFILQGAEDNYHTDLFLPIRNAVSDALPDARRTEKLELAVNAAADHVRALVFALSEGVMPSNEGRGYVLRRLLRRALTKMHPFGVKEPILAPAVDAVIDTMGGRYPELRQRGGLVKKVITAEEEHFLSTIEQGWNKFQDVIARAKKDKSRPIPGRDAFVLYDTFGFPLELTVELADDAGLRVDESGYRAEMEKQKERSRKHVTFHDSSGKDSPGEVLTQTFARVEKTDFLGYEELECDAQLGEIVVFGGGGDSRTAVVTDRTVFYPEGGGQVGDVGTLRIEETSLDVIDTYRDDGRIFHVLKDEGFGTSEYSGSLAAHLSVDRETRLATARNHTATHLLHKSLRETLGDHVTQAGSLVAPERLRFDFHHFQAVEPGELARIERMVNEAVLADLAVTYRTVPYKEAIAQGAMALFGEKYGDDVRVVSIENFSKELCGGTHLKHTGEIGPFIITHETAVAAGVRRVEALTGTGAFAYFKKIMNEREALSDLLRIAPGDIDRRVRQLLDENEQLRKKLSDQESEQAGRDLSNAVKDAERIGDIQFVTFATRAGDLATLRQSGDRLREQMDLGAALLCLALDKKPIVLIIVSDRLISEKGIKANDLARRIGDEFSFRGGGKPHMAQLGIGRPGDFDKIRDFVRALLAESG